MDNEQQCQMSSQPGRISRASSTKLFAAFILPQMSSSLAGSVMSMLSSMSPNRSLAMVESSAFAAATSEPWNLFPG